MLKFDEFNKLIKDFSSVADFLIIYIEEAHAVGMVHSLQDEKYVSKDGNCKWEGNLPQIKSGNTKSRYQFVSLIFQRFYSQT